MSVLSPLSGVKRKSDFGAVRSVDALTGVASIADFGYFDQRRDCLMNVKLRRAIVGGDDDDGVRDKSGRSALASAVLTPSA
jgi:hypothetical protein